MFLLKTRLSNVDYTNTTTLTNWVREQDFTLIMRCNPTFTEQLPTPLNPLKSYLHSLLNKTSSAVFAPDGNFMGLIEKDENGKIKYKFVIN